MSENNNDKQHLVFQLLNTLSPRKGIFVNSSKFVYAYLTPRFYLLLMLLITIKLDRRIINLNLKEIQGYLELNKAIKFGIRY